MKPGDPLAYNRLVEADEARIVMHGSNVGCLATVVQVRGGRATVRGRAWGEEVEFEVAPDDLGPVHTPAGYSFDALLARFDATYACAAPLRHARLQPGLDAAAVRRAWGARGAALPDEYVRFYQWRNGFPYDLDGWHDEFGSGGWWESLPLGDVDHLLSVEAAVASEAMWASIRSEPRVDGRPWHFRPGFVPLAALQSYGLLVIDTRGYFGGRPGQVVSFDFKSSNGFVVECETLGRWLETRLALLEAGALFDPTRHHAVEIELRINGYYRHRFPPHVPLDDLL